MGAIAEQPAELSVLDPALDEPEIRGGPQDRQVALLDLTRVVVGEAVDADDIGSPARTSRSASVDPMNPATPVTNAFMTLA